MPHLLAVGPGRAVSRNGLPGIGLSLAKTEMR